MIINMFNRIFLTDNNINTLPQFNYDHMMDAFHMNLNTEKNITGSINALYDYIQSSIKNNSYNFIECGGPKQFRRILSNYLAYIYPQSDPDIIPIIIDAYNKQYLEFEDTFISIGLVPEKQKELLDPKYFVDRFNNITKCGYLNKELYNMDELYMPEEMIKDLPTEILIHSKEELYTMDKGILINKAKAFIAYDLMDILQKFNLYLYNIGKPILEFKSHKPLDKYIIEDILPYKDKVLKIDDWLCKQNVYLTTNYIETNLPYFNSFERFLITYGYSSNEFDLTNYFTYVDSDRGYTGMNKFKYNKYLEKAKYTSHTMSKEYYKDFSQKELANLLKKSLNL